jgi:hypothetical protein
MELVTVVNRTPRKLRATWDGKEYSIEPGESAHPIVIAEALKRANPIMGSDDPYTGCMQYLIGIKEQGDPTDPVEQSDEIELYNRKALKNAVPIVIVQGKAGLYADERHSNIGLNSIPVKP